MRYGTGTDAAGKHRGIPGGDGQAGDEQSHGAEITGCGGGAEPGQYTRGGGQAETTVPETEETEAAVEDTTEVTEEPQPEVTPTPEPTPEVTVESETPQTQAAVAQPTAYTIKKGDTLIGISLRNYGSNTKVSEICALNGITDPDDIKIGQEILLP